MNKILFLDIDGVLVTTFPRTQPDVMDEDGYSKFNSECLFNFKSLLKSYPDLRIIVTSSRRIGKSLERLEEIFAYRGIENRIIAKIPDPSEKILDRATEIKVYIEEKGIEDFIIIDDDESLLNLEARHQKYLLKTNYRSGFDKPSLEKAYDIISSWD